jgi:hypothetical protein
VVDALARTEKGPLINDPATLHKIVAALSQRLVKLPTADANEENLMMAAADVLHRCA